MTDKEKQEELERTPKIEGEWDDFYLRIARKKEMTDKEKQERREELKRAYEIQRQWDDYYFRIAMTASTISLIASIIALVVKIVTK